MKNLSILGSTGSIGCNVLEIVSMFPERFSVKALSAKDNIPVLADQIEKFHPEIAVVFDEAAAALLKTALPGSAGVDILCGEEGYNAAASLASADLVVVAMVGAAGLMPTLSAVAAKKNIALANKEALVMAGDSVIEQAKKNQVTILPIDSEHSAIFQCIGGNRKEDLNKIFLTASGGPFLNLPDGKFDKIKPEDALNHPNWKMGRKISVDSATLMNKGLEVIEAKCLFGVSKEMIEVVIHPQSVVHSMVSFKDGTVMAQLGIPDMKGAIAYAMSYPERLALKQPEPDFTRIGKLTFEKPDVEKFPCLALAYHACEIGKTLPAVLNAANEIVVAAFLENKISFTNIPEIIKRTMKNHTVAHAPTLGDILEADHWARKEAADLIKDLNIERPTSNVK